MTYTHSISTQNCYITKMLYVCCTLYFSLIFPISILFLFMRSHTHTICAQCWNNSWHVHCVSVSPFALFSSCPQCFCVHYTHTIQFLFCSSLLSVECMYLSLLSLLSFAPFCENCRCCCCCCCSSLFSTKLMLENAHGMRTFANEHWTLNTRAMDDWGTDRKR